MEATFEGQATAFIEKVAQEQKKLLAYALHLTKDQDSGHDLYADTLLKCRERIAISGFNGEGYVAYMITSMKGNFYYTKRNSMKFQALDLVTGQADESDNTEECIALASWVRAFIIAHFTPGEVAAFELHVQGLKLPEIVFLTDYTYTVQVHRVIQKIKKGVRVAFGK